jgi:acyl dehydratase
VSQVWPGDRLTATATVTAVRDDDVAELTISTTNTAGDVVLAATATVRLA